MRGKYSGIKFTTEAVDFKFIWTGRGALWLHRSSTVRCCGAATKANVGMSNDKRGEKPLRRKTKVSSFYANQNRVSRDLRCSRKAKPMANGLIFPYLLTMKVTEACSWCALTE